MEDITRAVLNLAQKKLKNFKTNSKGDELIAETCPFCNGGDHHDKYSFYINMETGAYQCKRGKCNAEGSFKTLCQKLDSAESYVYNHPQIRAKSEKIYQKIDANILKMAANEYDAFVLESYGVGGIPEGDKYNFHSCLQELIRRGKTIVLTTQAIYEGSDITVYHSGHVAKTEFGVLESGDMTLEVVPFTHIQEEIRDKCPEEYFTLIMRRFMMRLAQRIAERVGAKAIVTGENLGQVASQTMEAMATTQAVTTLPVLQPLVGMDKEEIVRCARKIGTFETSILPYEDCCTVFTPRHPRTHPKLQDVEAAESALDVAALVEEALSGVEQIRL